MVDIDALVASVAGGRPGTAQCWATHLEGDAKEFMDGLEKAEDEDPGAVFRKGATDIMGKLGVKVTPESISHHLRRECLCRPKT